jgi:hypothetical protein
MIASPTLPICHAGQVLAHHAIHDTLLDLALGDLTVHIGSWPDAQAQGAPWLVTTLLLHYDAWEPEHFTRLPVSVSSHPVWCGDGPLPPTTAHGWNPVALRWDAPPTPPLPDLKDAKWLAIKSARSQAEYAGFAWDGSTFDSDPVSQQRLVAAVTQAQMDAAFSIGWTLKDNSVRQLDAVQMKAVGAALGAHVATQFAHGQGLRVRIEAATTAAEVALMVW